MKKYIFLFVLGAIFIPVLTWAESPTQDGTAMTIFRLENDKTYYFGSEWEHTYYEFGNDGAYRKISTEERSSGEADKGTWKQIKDGRIQLISEKRFHDLYSDILYIDVFTEKDLERVAQAKEILRAFLGREKRDEFTRHEIKNLMRYKTRGNVSRHVIGVAPRRSHITRAELEKSLADIDAYIDGEKKSVFYITPYLYQSKVLLAIPHDLVDDSDDPARIQKHIDTASGPHKWSAQIIKIDQEDFELAIADFRHPYKNELFEEDPDYHPRSSGETAAVRDAIQVHTFPKGKDLFFTKSGAHTIYLALRADGKYRETESSHHATTQTDHGTWSQGSDGILRLISAERFNDICAGWLEVRLYNENQAAALGELKSLINNFLEIHKQDRFTRKEVMGITKNLRKSGSSVPDIDFFLSADFATRQDLEELMASIDRYLPDKEKNVFRITPYAYKSIVFLLPEGELSDVDNVIEYFDNGWYPSFVFVATDKKTFDDGSKKSQPFRFFPEMNKKAKEEKKK